MTSASTSPDTTSAELERAAALAEAGNLAEAERICAGVLATAPDHFDALHQLALIKARQGKFDDGLRVIDRALAVNPDATGAHINRGNLLRVLNRPEDALAAFDAALALDPTLLGAVNNRGNVLWQLGRGEESIAAFEQVLRHVPKQPDALLNIGRSLAGLKRFSEAYTTYDKLLAQDSNNFACLYNYATALEAEGKAEEALIKYQRAHTLNPKHFGAAYAALINQLRFCDWCDWPQLVETVVAGVRAGKTGLGPLNFMLVSDDPADHLACARLWAQTQYPPSPTPLWNGERYKHERIRVAYLSSDFREHATSYLAAGLFEHHDRNRFEVTAVSNCEVTDNAMRHRLKRAFEHFIDVPDKSDREVASMLREKEIDIVVDLNGHTVGSRTAALAMRPSPVAVSYLGFPGTMGTGYIDYILADTSVIPAEQRSFYSEQVVWLPGCYQVNDARRHVTERAPSRAEAGLPERGFVFCAFVRSNKITPLFFDVWMDLLKEVEGSVLWLRNTSPAAVSNLRQEAVQRGVAPERLVFAPLAAQADHLARHVHADLFLDTAPYNAHTTASDALWMGLPVLTCRGGSFPSRVAASILSAAGLPELITTSMEGYRARALDLARDPAALAALKAKIVRERATMPLFDTARFARHLEAAYVTMWERTQRGEAPAGFAVSPSRAAQS